MKVLNLYLLSRVDHDVLVPFLARLGEKALEQDLRVWIDADDETLVRQLDAYLWTWREPSFVPHGTEPDVWNRLVIAPLRGPLPEGYTAIVHVCPRSPVVVPPAHAVKIAEVHHGEDEDEEFLEDRLRTYGRAGWEIQTFRITPTPIIPKHQRM